MIDVNAFRNLRADQAEDREIELDRATESEEQSLLHDFQARNAEGHPRADPPRRQP
jgi:hypothetical protein